jgi:hypothetical protein
MVGKEGGVFTLRGATVNVPEGAVTRDTLLTVGAPHVLTAGSSDGPLSTVRSAGVQFDVSLSRGNNKNIQPLVSLFATVPMSGVFAPKGWSTMHVLPYTADGHGGYLVLPYEAQRTSLIIEMSHLSPKFVAYVSDEQLLREFDADKTNADRGSCVKQVTASGIKVKFGPRSRGWSDKDDSAVFACLATGGDGYARVNMVNRVDYVLSVAATSNVRLAASPGDAETQIIKSLARNIFNLSKVKVYAGLDDKIVGSIKASDLPATIELQGDPHTYLAEAVWRALTVSVMVFIGEDSGETARLVKLLIESTDTTSCLHDQLTADGEADWYKAVRAVTDCSGPILDVLAKHLPSLDILRRAQAVWSSTVALTESLVRAGNGIKLQFINTLRVQVVAVAPPVPECPSGAALQRLVQSGIVYPGTVASNVRRNFCDGAWLTGVSDYSNGDPATATSAGFVAHLTGGTWKLVESGQDMGASPYCKQQIPTGVRESLGCYS